MKRIWAVALVAVLIVAGFAVAKAADQKAAAAAPKSVTMTGEIVDTDCYIGHGAMGEKHKECAATCVNSGTPMGLLTEKGVLYLLTPPHDNKDGYNKAKEMVSQKVAVTGEVGERAGMKMIEVMSVAPAAAPAATKKS
jgi:hypothetical protein